MKKISNIIFDYDGTLHNSIIIYAEAFRQAYKYLVEKGYAKERTWEDREISLKTFILVKILNLYRSMKSSTQ